TRVTSGIVPTSRHSCVAAILARRRRIGRSRWHHRCTRGPRMNRRRTGGFTLIELLVVVAVIGILAAVAIPEFKYQDKAFQARIMTDLRNAATAQESSFADKLTYSSNCPALPGFKLSGGVTFTACNGTAQTYLMTATHPNTAKVCTYDSTA